MRGMETTANTTVDTATWTAEMTVLEGPLSAPAALRAMDADGYLTAVVPVDLHFLLEGRTEQEAGEDYAIVNAMVEDTLDPMEMSYEVGGHRAGNVLLLKGLFDLNEAVAVSYSEDEIAEMESQPA